MSLFRFAVLLPHQSLLAHPRVEPGQHSVVVPLLAHPRVEPGKYSVVVPLLAQPRVKPWKYSVKLRTKTKSICQRGSSLFAFVLMSDLSNRLFSLFAVQFITKFMVAMESPVLQGPRRRRVAQSCVRKARVV